MSSWEERMVERAKARRAGADAEEAAKDAAEMEALREKYGPPLHPDGGGPSETAPHVGHYWHPHVGYGTFCSCGVALGVSAIALLDDCTPPEPCPVCEARGIRQH